MFGLIPYEVQKTLLHGYEALPCKIVSKGNRTWIITRSLGFNFTEFVIRLAENPGALDDGHGVICSVFDTDGELLVRSRRMVFLKGTRADDQLQGMTAGKRLHVIGIPRISLKLVKWRLEHKDGQFDVSPLEWRL